MSFVNYCDHMDMAYLKRDPTKPQTYDGIGKFICKACNAHMQIAFSDLQKFKNYKPDKILQSVKALPSITPECSCLTCSRYTPNKSNLINNYQKQPVVMAKREFNVNPLDNQLNNFYDAKAESFSISNDLTEQFKEYDNCNCMNCVLKKNKILIK